MARPHFDGTEAPFFFISLAWARSRKTFSLAVLIPGLAYDPWSWPFLFCEWRVVVVAHSKSCHNCGHPSSLCDSLSGASRKGIRGCGGFLSVKQRQRSSHISKVVVTISSWRNYHWWPWIACRIVHLWFLLHPIPKKRNQKNKNPLFSSIRWTAAASRDYLMLLAYT